MPSDSARAQVVFTTAVEIADPVVRASHVAQMCGDDRLLKARVEALLRAHDQPDSLLDAPLVSPPDPDHATTRAFSPDSDPADTRTGGTGEAASDEIPLGFLAPSARPDSLGRIGHYEVLQILGQGGFGIVFRAFDDVLQRVVAVKVLAPQLAATSPARKRFLREARTSAAVRHENVVQVYEVGEAPLPFLVMEFIPGETLQQRLNRVGPVEPIEVVRIGRQIAEGLAAAHATDLIHRDIKPGNILLEGGAGRVKITDFGLARAADDASISQSGLIAGTPMYMAPEQAKGEKLDQRADLFSLGSVLYQMACGRPPFRANSTVAVLKRVAEDTPRDIREITPEVPQWLCDIIAKLHAKNPDDRFQSAREVADVLADCEAQLKANSKLKDFSRIPTSKRKPVGRKRLIAAAVLVLPVLALALTEFAGLTHLFRGQQASIDPLKPGGEPVAKQEPPSLAIAPFDATQARAHQEAWAKYLGVPVECTNSIGMKFCLIPPGEFTMGGTPAEVEAALTLVAEPGWRERLQSEAPQHKVTLTRPIYVGITEVTQSQYAKVMGTNPAHFSATGPNPARVAPFDTTVFPVENVSWHNAVEFCAKLSQLEKPGLNEVQVGHAVPPRDVNAYRLPTEAEWEFACRAGTATRFWKGDSDEDAFSIAWTGSNSPGRRPHAVAELASNPFGLYDVHGNVWEWVQDRWEPTYFGKLRDKTAIDPTGSTEGDMRIARGGACYLLDPTYCRAAVRVAFHPAHQNGDVGFRVVLPVHLVRQRPSEMQAPQVAVAPFTDADVQRIAALPAEQQIEEVRKELVRRNPGFDGTLETKIEDGIVKSLAIVTDNVTDISPIRVFNNLQTLDCAGTGLDEIGRGKGTLADLSPLKSMDLSQLVWLNLARTRVTNEELTPFANCQNLQGLQLNGLRIDDEGLAHFKNCADLRTLDLINTRVTDSGLAGFKRCKDLVQLHLLGTRITDAGLAHFKDCKQLERLFVHWTGVTNTGLAHFKDFTQLNTLHINNTKITDLSLVKDLPLKSLSCDFVRERDEKILRSIKTLETINDKPAAEFWKDVEAGKYDFLPFTDADVKRIAALPAKQQIEEVRKELKRRNPDFDGPLDPTLEEDAVVGLKLATDQVKDISPLRALTRLRDLRVEGLAGGETAGLLADLSPLKGMQLTSLEIVHNRVTDLSPLRGMPLRKMQIAANPVEDLSVLQQLPLVSLSLQALPIEDLKALKGLKLESLLCFNLPITDISPLKSMPLQGLYLHRTSVSDLTPLQGMKLTILNVSLSKVSDLSPLKGMPLEDLHIGETQVTDLLPLKDSKIKKLFGDFQPERDFPILREIKTLETINNKPAAEFLKDDK